MTIRRTETAVRVVLAVAVCAVVPGCRRDAAVRPAAPVRRSVRLVVQARAATPEPLEVVARLTARQELRRAGLLATGGSSRGALRVVLAPSASGKQVTLQLRTSRGVKRRSLVLSRCCTASQVGTLRQAVRGLLFHVRGGSIQPDRKLWDRGPHSRDDLANAQTAGLRWIVSRALQANAGDLSDYLQVFYILREAARDPELRRVGRRLATRLAKRYLKVVTPPRSTDSADDLFDHAAALFLLDRIGVKPPLAYRAAVRLAFNRASAAKLLRQNEQTSHERQVLDELVDLYFLYKLGLPSPRAYDLVIRRARQYRLVADPKITLAALEDRTYLATHILYVLSGFNLSQLPRKQVAAQVRYLLQVAPRYLAAGDVETLGELGDALKIAGLGYESPALRRIVTRLLVSQNGDGSWGDPGDTDSYRRYHTTWTAFNGLLEFRFPGRGIVDSGVRRAWQTARPKTTSQARLFD